MSSASHVADPGLNPGEGNGTTKINRQFLDFCFFLAKKCADAKNDEDESLNGGGIGGPITYPCGRCVNGVVSYRDLL